MDIEPVCPHARKVTGSSPGMGGVVCGVMERDAMRADPILEGAPIGVFVSEGEDPSTLMNMCCGQGAPIVDLAALPERDFGQGHYSACPIYEAGQSISEWEKEAQGGKVIPSADRTDHTSAGGIGAMDLTDSDLDGLGL